MRFSVCSATTIFSHSLFLSIVCFAFAVCVVYMYVCICETMVSILMCTKVTNKRPYVVCFMYALNEMSCVSLSLLDCVFVPLFFLLSHSLALVSLTELCAQHALSFSLSLLLYFSLFSLSSCAYFDFWPLIFVACVFLSVCLCIYLHCDCMFILYLYDLLMLIFDFIRSTGL